MAWTAPTQRWDHELRIGDTYSPGVVALQDDAGTGYDITGSTGVVKLRREPGGEVILTATYAIVTAASGEFQWTASAADTSALQPGVYHYGVRITFSGGEKSTVLAGLVTVLPSLVD